jgi:hypothetical protein
MIAEYSKLSRKQLETMLAAGEEVAECTRRRQPRKSLPS